MGVFKLLVTLCEELEQLIRYFWWGRKRVKEKCIGTPRKNYCSLSVREDWASEICVNQALLAQQSWRLLQFPDSLCMRVLKAKYYPNGELVDTVFPVEESPTWRAVEHGLELLKKGIIWRISSGTKVNIWRDPWIPEITFT
jgi:hypothetical protein